MKFSRNTHDLRLSGLALMTLAAACGSPPEAAAPSPAAPVARKSEPRGTAMRCPASIDVRDLLGRHARAFGSMEAIARVPLRELKGLTFVDSQTGTTEIVLAPAAFREIVSVGGLAGASGIDADGAWDLPAGSGVVERLHGSDEEIDVRFDEWLWRRRYLDTSANGAVKASCLNEVMGPRVDLAFAKPEIGSPTLSFDLERGSLVAASHVQTDGRKESVAFEAWSEPDPSVVRWPKKTTTHLARGSDMLTNFEAPGSTASCVERRDDGEAVLRSGPECAAAPPSTARIRWPATGRARVPLAFVRRSLFVRAKASGRELDALLDSGASITVVDATTPAASLFQPVGQLEGASSTQKIRAGIGQLTAVGMSDLVIGNVPAASVPIPALDAMGKRRPEVILGYTFFASGVVRIDFQKSEIVLAKPGTQLAAANARSVPLRVARGKLLVEANVEGQRAWFELDTGNTGGLDLFKKWEDAHGLPGDRPTATASGRFGAGTSVTTARFFRLRSASLGPIDFAGGLVHDGDPPDMGIVAGLAGNALFARCDAIVVDHDARKLWFEGACNRALPENKMMWRLSRERDRQGEAVFVDVVVPGSSVDAAGIKEGDKVLEIAGKPVPEDLTSLEAIEMQSEGAKVPVVFEHAGMKRRVVVDLQRLLP